MAHFNPQMCEPSCCVNCAGSITLNEDNCTLCWETSGDVIRAELWRIDDPPVMVSDAATSGCICDPEPGDYELRVFCSVGDGEITLVVDEDTVPDDWECTLKCKCDCEELQAAGYTGLEVTFSANASEWNEANGTYFFPFGSVCSGFSQLKGKVVTRSGVIDRPHPRSDVSWEIGHDSSYIYYGVSCLWTGQIAVNVDISVGVFASPVGVGGNVLDPIPPCVPEDYAVSGGRISWNFNAGGFGLLSQSKTITDIPLGNRRVSVRWYCPDYPNLESTGTLSAATIAWRLVK
jgi:hypothetical protein